LRSPLSAENLADKLDMILLLFKFGARIEHYIIEDSIDVCREFFASGNFDFFRLKRKIVKELFACMISSKFLYYVRSNNIEKTKEYLEKTHNLADSCSPIELCSFKINPNIDFGFYGMAIMLAASLESPEMLELLSSLGADLSIPDSNGFNVIHYAARYGSTKNVKWILDKITSKSINPCLFLDAQDSVDGNTPLHLAIQYGQFFTADTLLKYKAKLSIKNNAGKTADKITQDPAMHMLCEMYKDGSPKLIWLCAKKIADSFEEVPGAPEHIQSLIFTAKTGNTLELQENEEVQVKTLSKIAPF
jgi:hypothetical protein